MHIQRLKTSVCLTVAVCLAAAGCGPKYPNEKQVFKVQGTVIVDGAPIPEIQVELHPVTPVNEKRPTFPKGFTDAEGKIRISTYVEGDGAPAGEYKVTFILQDYNIMGRNYSGPDKLKKKYSDPKTTPISLTLGEGKPNDLGKVELTTK